MKDFISKMFSDGFGFPSLQRVLAAVIVVPVVYVPLIVWARASWTINDGTVAEMPGSVIGFIGAILGPVLAFVFAGKWQETKVEIAEITGQPPPGRNPFVVPDDNR